MKNFNLILFVLLSLNLQAQKNVEKEISYQDQLVEINLDFASKIEMKTWNNSVVRIEASVKTKDKKYTELYELQVNSTNSKIEIGSNSKDLFKAYRDDHSCEYRDIDHEFNYTIFVPEGVNLDLSSITGRVTSEFLKGNFKIDLTTGNIDIEKFEGDLDLKSITGKIDLPVKNSSYSAKTVMGNIHADPDPAAENKSKFMGQEIIRDLKNAENRVTLNTVTGDIYLK